MMKRHKDLILATDQKAFVLNDEIILDFGYLRLNRKNAKKLSKWLMDVGEYLKNQDENKYKPIMESK